MLRAKGEFVVPNRWLFFVAVLAVSSGLVMGTGTPFSKTMADEAKPRVLFITQSKGYVHNAVKRGPAQRSRAELAMLQLAKDSGQFTVVCSQNAEADFTPENLENFEIVVFYTSGDLPIDETRFEFFLKDWLPKAGHGFIGFHSASDTFHNFEPYWDLVGGTFAGHPWGANARVSLVVHDTDHPTMKPFGERLDTQEEIYQYSHWQPEKVRVLMSLDMEHTPIKRPYHVPVAWCKQVGNGRMFYNNMGHRDETWTDPKFLDSVLAAVRWTAGLTSGSAVPNPSVSTRQHDLSIQFSHAAGVTEASLAAEKAAQEAARRAREKAAAKSKQRKPK